MELNYFVVYGYSTDNDKIPIGVISKNSEKKAYCYQVPERIKTFLVEIEDQRFYKHAGIDTRGLSRAIFHNICNLNINEGGSTITQQLARNLLKDNRKNFQRKLKEAFVAKKLETNYSKKEILTMYFNEVYWGKNIYGIRAASLSFFKKEPSELNIPEQLALLTLLRGPNYYLNNSKKFENRYDLLNSLMFKRNQISSNRRIKNGAKRISINYTNLLTFSNQSALLLQEKVDFKNFSIQTNLIQEIQKIFTQYTTSAIYPTSIVCLYKGKIVAVSSSYGVDHSINFKTNIGSLIKPLLYIFLRKNGVLKNEYFDTSVEMPIGWNVREISKYPDMQSIEEGLFHSSNKVFIKACLKVGIENTIQFLSNILELPVEDIHLATILGATSHGISLLHIARIYEKHILLNNDDLITKECLSILNNNAKSKFLDPITNIFLKTGTTNENLQRLAIAGESEWLIAIMRENNPISDYSKDGNFVLGFKKMIDRVQNFFSNKKSYKWMN